MEEAIRKAVQERLKEIAEEELQAAVQKIRARLVEDVASLAPQILSRIVYAAGTQELVIRIGK